MKNKNFNIYVDNIYVMTVVEYLLKESLIFLINTLNIGSSTKCLIDIVEVKE